MLRLDNLGAIFGSKYLSKAYNKTVAVKLPRTTVENVERLILMFLMSLIPFIVFLFNSLHRNYKVQIWLKILE